MTTIDIQVIRERVVRGARLLDERRPGWADRVVLDRLAMDSCRRCILGQVYGYYSGGLGKLFGDASDQDGEGGWYGFNVAGIGDSPSGDEEYAALAEAWRAEVRARVQPGWEVIEDDGMPD